MALGFIGALIVLALSSGLNLLLRPRIKRARPGALEFAKADEGVPIPIGYGRFAVAMNVIWCGDLRTHTGDNGVYVYDACMIATLCLGPVDG